MSVTFGFPISVQFPSDPWFIRRIPWFLCQFFLPSSTVPETYMDWYSYIVSNACPSRAHVQCANWGGSCRWQKCLRGCARKIILAREADSQSWVPFQFLFHQGTGEEISEDYEGLKPFKCDGDTCVDPSKYVFDFCRHESTQICEY